MFLTVRDWWSLTFHQNVLEKFIKRSGWQVIYKNVGPFLDMFVSTFLPGDLTCFSLILLIFFSTELFNGVMLITQNTPNVVFFG